MDRRIDLTGNIENRPRQENDGCGELTLCGHLQSQLAFWDPQGSLANRSPVVATQAYCLSVELPGAQ